jgi:hypothetical protein
MGHLAWSIFGTGKILQTHLSDDKTVAKMGHPVIVLLMIPKLCT